MDESLPVGGDGLPAVDPLTERLLSITQGAQHLVVVARQRIAQTLDALDAGDFEATVQRLNEAIGVLTPVLNAQLYVAVADGNKLIRARELVDGMVLTGVGSVESVSHNEPCSHCGDEHVRVKVAGGEHELNLHSDQELYVVREAA